MVIALGLTVLTTAYAIGSVSSCRLNPTVSVGFRAQPRFLAKDLTHPKPDPGCLSGVVIAAGIPRLAYGTCGKQPDTVSKAHGPRT
ncbi:MAG: hypothetical protein U0807_10220 [Candidatus Binatia bacterium]